MTAFDSNDPDEHDEPTRRGLRVRIAPNLPSADEHAQQMLRMQARHQGQPPIIPARDQAVAPTVCDECGEQMWASIISRRDICSVCRAKEETTRSTILGQIMDRFS